MDATVTMSARTEPRATTNGGSYHPGERRFQIFRAPARQEGVVGVVCFRRCGAWLEVASVLTCAGLGQSKSALSAQLSSRT